MGDSNKLFRVFILISVVLCSHHARLASGATVFSPSIISNDQAQIGGCVLPLPINRNYAPAITDQKTHEPLLPTQNKGSGFWYLKIEQDQKIKLNCGRGNTLSEFDPYYYLLLSCVRGSEFLNDEDELILLPEGVECSNPRKPTPIVYRNGTCSGTGTNFDVEFITESPPRKFYSVCMDERISGSLYSSSYIDGKSFANGLVEGSGNRPDFRGHEFYPFAIKQAYKWENAYEHLSDLLGSSDLVDEYFPTQQYRFSRGHLFPNADGVKRFEKHATFYYMHTVPQWQLLNGGNWATIEQDVRDFAKSLSRTFKVFTGSFDVTTLKDGNNNDVKIYLARDPTGKLRLPVPRIVWKVVHDPAGDSAVAIVQINNPWVQVQNLYRGTDILCSDVCSSLPWLRSSAFHVTRKGYTYCCDVKELRRAIPYIPDIKYSGLLGVGYVDNNANGNNYEDGDDDDDDEDEEDELDGSRSSDSSDSSSSSEEKLKNYNLDEQNITALFSSIRIG